MHARTMGVLAALVATLALALAVDGAAARNFELSNQHFRITWTELAFFDQGLAEFVALCPVTLEGSFHRRTFAKVVGSLIGHITRAVVRENACRDPAGAAASARFLPESLPWHITYAGFSGFLPRIESLRVRILGIRFENSIRGMACLFNGAATQMNATFFVAGGVMTSFEFERGTVLPPMAGNNCAVFGINGGLERLSTSLTLLNTINRIMLLLI